MLSVRFEVGVSLLLAPTGADKRGPKAPFPLVRYAGIQPAIREYPPELRRAPGLTESTGLMNNITDSGSYICKWLL